MTDTEHIAAIGPPLFTQARRVRSFEDIVEQIGTAILDGRLTIGSRLPNERTLCQMFGVSRSTLREGLRALEAQGIVEIRSGASGGSFVSEPGSDQLGRALQALIQFNAATARDLMEFRLSFESETAYWAAQRADADDQKELKQIVERFAAVARDSHAPWRKLAELDIDFHNAVARASKNQIRVAIMLGIYRSLFRASLSIQPVASASLRRSIEKELRSINEAIGQHDHARAKRLMLAHVKRFSQLEFKIQEEIPERSKSPKDPSTT
jgi:GntR family transcriptional regulator, transcriptional repressor for pyruvate dehydrogenase complex